MRKLPAAPRALCVVLSAALLWSSPGLAAHAAAAEIVRPVEAVGLGGAAAIPAAPAAPGLSAPSLLSASALNAAPLSAAAAAALSAPAVDAAAAPSAAPTPALAAALPSAAAAETPRAPEASAAPAARPAALESAGAASAPAADRAWSLTRLFDGASTGLRRLVGAPSAAPAALPALPYGLVRSGEPALARAGERRATLLLRDPGSDDQAAMLLHRLNSNFGFRADDAPTRVDGALRVSGVVPTEDVLALAVSNRVLDLQLGGGAPEPEGPGRLRAAAARLTSAMRPAREPFTPATRLVAGLERLAASDPAKARAQAMEYVSGGKESRREVKLAALRALDAAPLAEIAPFYLKTLAAGADPKIQAAKADGKDSIWFVQRAILSRWAREAESLKSDADVVSAAKKAYEDRNASVRLAAAAALRAMGVDPGPENEYLPAAAATSSDGPFATPPAVNSEINAYPDPNVTVAPGVGKRLLKALAVGAALGAILLGLWSVSQTSPRAHAPAPSAPITRTIPQTPTISAAPSAGSEAPAPPVVKAAPEAGAPPAAAPAATDHDLLEQIAKSEQRIAQAQEEQVAAQKAAQKGGGLMSGIVGMIINAAIFIGLFALLGRLFKGFGGGASGAGGMTAKTETKSEVEKPTQRFTDVEGADESLVEVQEVVDFLRDPSRFARMGGKSPKGVLFEGPPGTGKTLMARAMAGETNSAFFAVSGSDFVELFVGMGARRVRELIQKAANNKPAIVFIDEIDAVGKKRGSNSGMGGDSEREQTINALLTAMDGFDNSGGIIFVAATNRADTLDPALLRPGRFDRKIFVGKPHMGGREAILTIHARDKRLAADVDLRQVARRTANLAGADLANVMNEAALLAVRRGADAIENQDLDEAVDRGTIGAKRSLPMPEALKKRIAYHEAGHVLANMLNEDPEMRKKVNKFTIVPHGSGALGFAEIGDEEGDKYLYTKEELEARIDHALGGLIAEKLVYGKTEKIPDEFSPDWSTGPGSDLEAATRTARYMVERLGMGESTGLAVTAPDSNDPFGRGFGGDRVAERNWLEVNKILAASYKRVKARLSRNRHVLEALTQAVLAKETLIGDEVDDVVRKAGPIDPPAAAPKN